MTCVLKLKSTESYRCSLSIACSGAVENTSPESPVLGLELPPSLLLTPTPPLYSPRYALSSVAVDRIELGLLAVLIVLPVFDQP